LARRQNYLVDVMRGMPSNLIIIIIIIIIIISY